jgi:hypothetical protein
VIVLLLQLVEASLLDSFFGYVSPRSASPEQGTSLTSEVMAPEPIQGAQLLVIRRRRLPQGSLPVVWFIEADSQKPRIRIENFRDVEDILFVLTHANHPRVTHRWMSAGRGPSDANPVRLSTMLLDEEEELQVRQIISKQSSPHKTSRRTI